MCIRDSSYADGDITFAWSPDSNWLTVDFIARKRIFITNIAVVPADGSAPPRDISLSGYQDGFPKWHADGGAVIWASSRYGQRDHGSWGREFDVMAAFLTQDAFDKFSMSKEDYELMKELEKEKEKEKEKKKKEEEAKKEAEKSEGDDGAKDKTCLLYTSDAADDLLCVDLGGRRIIKKKKINIEKIEQYLVVHK
eukprot:TRINITY_DN3715_c0_g1_i1.p1 TRINITY_DN3715_c0_g1~~TRINITY_DN3715_c0_g1_i1.p1  ORF type:complete len:195 (+),score=85.05 TRINITY_DN3715_c0_g1_i1:185-769(+)